jgi:hypothetical protein
MLPGDVRKSWMVRVKRDRDQDNTGQRMQWNYPSLKGPAGIGGAERFAGGRRFTGGYLSGLNF